MATKLNTTTSFIAQLLAPIADTEEQADTKAFRKLVERDTRLSWSREMNKVREADAKHTLAVVAFEKDRPNGDSREIAWAYASVMVAEAAQCLIPAPSMTEVRWKKRRTAKVLQCLGVAEAIARDEARLAA